MAYPATSGKLADLINPEVMAAMINKKLINNIVFAPLAKIDTTLVGRPGDTVTLPHFNYIGDAADVLEGADVSVTKLVAASTPVQVKKAGKGIQLTDEAVLSGYGDPVGEAVKQLRTSIAAKIDTDLAGAITAGVTAGTVQKYQYTTAELDMEALIKAIALFGEDLAGTKNLVIDPTHYAQLVANTFGRTENYIVSGTVEKLLGCNIIVSDRVVNPFIVKPEALALFMKRDTLVEADRDIINKSTIITADKHYAAYLYDAGKVIAIEKQ